MKQVFKSATIFSFQSKNEPCHAKEGLYIIFVKCLLFGDSIALIIGPYLVRTMKRMYPREMVEKACKNDTTSFS